jgi:CDP-diacylglycerol pyrophosphatase
VKRPLTSRLATLASFHVATLLSLWAWPALADGRATLWDIVHDQCLVTARNDPNPAPCSYVETYMGVAKGYAVLKDLVGDAQFLLIPTKRVPGIESPDIVASDAPNYWQAAWEARRYLNQKLQRSLPRNAIGMAVNSSAKRGQDQLHIHIDCVQPEVMKALAAHADDIGEKWHTIPFTLMGRHFVARQVNSPDLEDVNPFRLLYSSSAEAAADMAHETLIVIGATFNNRREGFVLLSEKATTVKGSGHGEDLLDHACAVRNSAP